MASRKRQDSWTSYKTFRSPSAISLGENQNSLTASTPPGAASPRLKLGDTLNSIQVGQPPPAVPESRTFVVHLSSKMLASESGKSNAPIAGKAHIDELVSNMESERRDIEMGRRSITADMFAMEQTGQHDPSTLSLIASCRKVISASRKREWELEQNIRRCQQELRKLSEQQKPKQPFWPSMIHVEGKGRVRRVTVPTDVEGEVLEWLEAYGCDWQES